MRVCFAFVLVLCGGVAGQSNAQTGALDECLQFGDAVFEQTLRTSPAPAEAERLEAFYQSVPRDCASRALDACESAQDSTICWGHVGAHIQDRRFDITARLPAQVQHSDQTIVDQYARSLSRSSTALCPRGTENEACFIAEGIALGAAYSAWRLAREVGAVPLVGHDPVDLGTVQ